SRAEGVVKTVAPRFDPEQHPNDREIEKENDVRHLATGKCDGDDGGATGDRPVGGDVEPLSPDHDAPHLAAIKMRHGIDVARVVNAALERDGRLLICGYYVVSCHGSD